MVVQILTDVNTLSESLNKELNFYTASGNVNEVVIKAKKKQIAKVSGLAQLIKEIQKSSDVLSELVFKLEACCLYHGISSYEVGGFVRGSQENVKSDLKALLKDGFVQVPLKIRPLLSEVRIDEMHEKWLRGELENVTLEKIKYAKGPTVQFDQLKSAAVAARENQVKSNETNL